MRKSRVLVSQAASAGRTGRFGICSHRASGAAAGPDRITAQARRSCSANSARHHVHYRASSLIGHAGRQAATIEMAVAFGVAYVVLGGAMLASVASFRLLSDKIDSFFALLIPKPADIQGVRNVPLDEGFSPFKFEQVRKPRAKLKSSDLASGRPPVAATSPKVSIPPALEVLQPLPPSQADQLWLAAPRESPACVTGATLSLHDIAPHFQRADRKNKSQACV